ncbi:endothelin-converting enzyme 2-like [Ornithodoros turicata]|uniref:endothelin-converting enzyme 2-like n=1 Tax=Ornithodoros turicata TaxID=34597 RepID=UPI0031397B47
MKRTAHPRSSKSGSHPDAPNQDKRSPIRVSYAGAPQPEPKASPSPLAAKASSPQTPRDGPPPHQLRRERPPERNRDRQSAHRGSRSPRPSPHDSPTPYRFKKYSSPAPEGFAGQTSPSPEARLRTSSYTPATSEQALRMVKRIGSLKQRYTAYAIVALFACALISVLLYVLIAKPFTSSEITRCTSDRCREYEAIVSLVSTSIDPCENFYRYVCDGWNSKEAVSVRRHQVERYIDYLDESADMIRVPPSNQSGEQKAIAFYRSCASIMDEHRDELPGVKQVLKKANLIWPHEAEHPNLLEAMFYIRRTLGLSLFFDIEVRANTTHTTVEFSAPSSLKKILDIEDKLVETGHYIQFSTFLLMRFMIPGKPASPARRNATEIVLTTLKTKLTSTRRNSTRILHYNMSEIAEATQWRGYSQERWEKAVTEYLGINNGISVHITISDSAYMQEFRSLLGYLGEGTLQLVGGYLLAIQVSVFANEGLLKNLYLGASKGESNSRKDNRDFCLRVTMKHMGSAYIHPHVSRWPDAEQQRELADIAEHVEAAFRAKYGVSNRRLADMVHNFTNVQRNVDIDKVYEHFKDMGKVFVENLQAAVEGFMMSRGESIEIPNMNLLEQTNISFYHLDTTINYLYFYPYAFAQPLYDSHGPLVSKYGGIASELGLAYGTLALRNQVDPSNATCLKDLDREIWKPLEIKDLLIRALALDAAWDSFKDAASKHHEVAGFHGFTDDQLFFVFFCHNMCSREKKWETLCNAPLRSNLMFSTVFGCSEESFMASGSVCFPSQKVYQSH